MKLNGDQVDVFADANKLTRGAAERFVVLAAKAIEDQGVFSVALSGGSTPKSLYQLMAADPLIRSKVQWSKVHMFFGDERHVPPDHAESNFRMANEAMLQSLACEQLHVHRVLAELPNAADAAAQYEEDLKEFFEPRGLLEGGFPRFDLIFLGMGPDGHTASLFPNSSGLDEKTGWIVANWVEKFHTDRITMTFPVLNSAAEVIVFVVGPEKASLLAEVLDAGATRTKYPVQEVKPRNGLKRWMLDAAAASAIATEPEAQVPGCAKRF
jgi:6-phosphogluconolactonase